MSRATAKVFQSGNSQAVRLPKSFRLDDSEVYIEQLGEVLLLIPKKAATKTFWQDWYNSLGEFEEGFELERNQPQKVDKRQW